MKHTQIRFTHVFAIFVLMGFFGVTQAGNEQYYTYSVISDKEGSWNKRTIQVRLPEKITMDELRLLSEELKKTEKKNYERTYIYYLLPGQKVGAGAWATSHFLPTVEVEILGLTLEETAKLVHRAKNNSADEVGIWLDDRPYVGSTITIRRKDGKLYIETKYEDGSGSNEEMTETKSGSSIKLVQAGRNIHGEYYILDQNNELSAGGLNGIFHTYKKIN